MRIGIIFGQLQNGGGAYQLIHLARELQKMGHTVDIFTYYTPEASFAKEWLVGLRVHSCVLPHKPVIHHDFQPIGLARYLIDIILMTIRLAWLTKNYVLDVLQPHEWPYQWAAVLATLWHRHAKIVWMCNDVWHIPGNEESREIRTLFRWANRYGILPLDIWFTKYIHTITVLDNRIQRIASHHYVTNTVRVVRSGIDLTPYQSLSSKRTARQKLSLPSGSWIWLCLSIVHPHRCFEDVIDALLLSSDTRSHLYIVGSQVHAAEYAATLRKRIATRGLSSRVTMIDAYISQQDKLLYYAAADGFIFPNDQQTWGLAVIEAMAAGLPCIVSSGAGVHEVIDHGETGLVYTRRDVHDLSIQMEAVVQNKQLRNQLIKQGKATVFRAYSWTTYAQQMEHFFRG